jgi:hypothetical protein
MMKRIATGLALIAMLGVSGRAGSAQAPAGPAGSGHWEGSISVQGKDLKLEVDLVAKGDKWEGAAGFPDMNAKGLPLAPITVQGQAVTFVVKGAPGDPTFKGTLSKDAKTLAGDFTQGPVTGTFTLAWKGEGKLEPAVKNAALGKDFEGAWEGALDVNGTALRLTLKLTNVDGGATGTMVSLDQGAAEIPLRVIDVKGAQVKFTVPAVGGSYEGELKDGQIVGTWAQGPGTLPLTFKRPAK